MSGTVWNKAPPHLSGEPAAELPPTVVVPKLHTFRSLQYHGYEDFGLCQVKKPRLAIHLPVHPNVEPPNMSEKRGGGEKIKFNLNN